MVVDPGGEVPTIVQLLRDNELKCNFILITHGHIDHFLAANELQAALGTCVTCFFLLCITLRLQILDQKLVCTQKIIFYG